MEPATVEAVKTVAEFDFKTGGAMAAAGAIFYKLIDKLPWYKIFSVARKEPVTKKDLDLAIHSHSDECRCKLDKRFADTIEEFKEWRHQDAEFRKEDIAERREFRKEMIDSLNRVHTRLDGKADK